MFRWYLFLSELRVGRMAAPLADDQQRPIPTSPAPCVVNLSIPSIIIVISNNSRCRLWPAVEMLMAIFPFDSSTTVGVNFAPTVATQCLWIWPSSLYCRIHYGTPPSDTRCKLTQQVPTGPAGRWSIHPSLLTITAFFVIPHIIDSRIPGRCSW